MGLLDGKVAVITGAGGGLGRAHALLFAREGASIVVNDLGGARDGTSSGTAPATSVVKEIVDQGGKAQANFDSVATFEGGRNIVKTALDAYGRIDILVNNAGILRDKTLLKMDEAMWDIVIAVHLKGTFLMSQLVACHMAERGGGGRIINTSSFAGLKGNYGQTNYAAAKAGIYGMTLVHSMELRKHGITVNAIAPLAKTRLTEEIEAVPQNFRPEQVSPMVLYLASDLAAEVTGRIFGIHGRQIFEYRMEMNEGITRQDGDWTAKEIADRMDEVGCFSEPPAASGSGAAEDPGARVKLAMPLLPKAFLPEKAPDWRAVIQFDVTEAGSYTLTVADGKASLVEGKAEKATCTVKLDAETIVGLMDGSVKGEQAFMAGKIKADNLGDMMKFGRAFRFDPLAIKEALGAKAPPPSLTARLGTKAAPPATDSGKQAKASDPRTGKIGHVYYGKAVFAKPDMIRAYALATNDENPAYLNAERGIVAPPVFGVRIARDILFDVLTDQDLSLDLLRLVHGEQELVFHAPIRPWDLLCPRAKLLSIKEKASGDLLVTVETHLYRDGEPTTEMRSLFFVRAEGKTKQKGTAKEEVDRGAPIVTQVMAVTDDQPLRYAKASCDNNPIHVDASAAKAAGHPNIILQGLCTMAFTGQAVIANLAGGDPLKLRRIAVRFSKPVLPGDKLTTNIWPGESPNNYLFETRNQEGVPVIKNGEAEILE